MELGGDKGIVVKEIHKSSRKNFTRRHVLQKGINDTLQIDLVEMIPYASSNKGFKYMLTVIDIFSKKAFARPLKNKTAKEVTQAMKSVLHEIGSTPKNVHSDQGKEFFNRDFQQLMKDKKINHYHTFTHCKASIVERFNRTLKNWMWMLFSYNGSYNWINLLDGLLQRYNRTYHRTIKMAPNAVTKRKEKLLLRTVYAYVNVYKGHKFKIGDKVRISKFKGIFSKGYEPNWSTEVFTVDKIKLTTPVTYLLCDNNETPISGVFYEQELQKCASPDVYLVEKVLKEKGDKLFVKWLGFSNEHNSWINKNQVTD